MAVICTKCGSTDVLCEALVNPNTEKVVSYHDGAFMYEYCNNCKDESMLTDTEGVKCDMENKYRQFCKVRKKKPDYAELEKLCGKKWVNPYKPEEERFVLTLTDEERSLIEERIKAGHYSSENIEKRRVEAHKAKMAAKRAEICERYDKKIRQAEAEKKIILCVFDYGLPINNVIYYPHTNTLSFNWNDYGGKITQEEFDDFVNNVDRSQLPEGIKFELK